MSKRSKRMEKANRERYQNDPPLQRARRKALLGERAARGDGSVIVHGGMKYCCDACGHTWFMCLEIGVEDNGDNGRPHQPCPFVIRCEKCGGPATDISGYLPLPDLRQLLDGMPYFAYDFSGDPMACGRPTVYHDQLSAEDIEQAVRRLQSSEVSELKSYRALLQQYEDIGLSPSEIKAKLRLLKRYEELGTVAELDQALFDATF